MVEKKEMSNTRRKLKLKQKQNTAHLELYRIVVFEPTMGEYDSGIVWPNVGVSLYVSSSLVLAAAAASPQKNVWPLNVWNAALSPGASPYWKRRVPFGSPLCDHISQSGLRGRKGRASKRAQETRRRGEGG